MQYEAERDRLVTEGFERKEVERRFAKAVQALGMSDPTGMGHAVLIGRCWSPIAEL